MAQATTKAIQPFSIPQTVLATSSDNSRPSSSSQATDFVSRLRRLPRELFLSILATLSYRDLILLALTCKAMANLILNEPHFTVVAAFEEAKHAALGHYEFVTNAYPGTCQHRSLLWCSHYTCPFHMRRLREWQQTVRKTMEALNPSQRALEEEEDKHRQN